VINGQQFHFNYGFINVCLPCCSVLVSWDLPSLTPLCSAMCNSFPAYGDLFVAFIVRSGLDSSGFLEDSNPDLFNETCRVRSIDMQLWPNGDFYDPQFINSPLVFCLNKKRMRVYDILMGKATREV